MREEWLAFPGTLEGPWGQTVTEADGRGIGTVRYQRLVPGDAKTAAQLSKRTLTGLYNLRPQWLQDLHHRLDEAVLAAYGWSPTLSDEELLARLLELNRSGSAN